MLKCTRCSAYQNEYNINCAPVFGNLSSPVLFVGEMYGRTECETGEPFVGRAGKKLNKLLKLIGLSRHEVAICNSLRCYIKDNTTPPKKMLDACFVHLLNDVEKIKPKIVVALGRIAFYQTTGMSKDEFSQHIGKVIQSERLKCPVFVTYHPAAALYDPNKWEKLLEDFRKISSLLGKEINIKHYEYLYIRSPEEFEKPFKWLGMGTEIYMDSETDGLNPYTGDIRLLQLSAGNEPIYIIDGSILSQVRPQLKHLFETRKLGVVGQGFEFDVKFLSVNHGIFPLNWYFDTCIAEYLISGMKHNDLSFLTSKYVPESNGYDSKVKLAGGAHKVLDLDELLQYAADDVGVMIKIKKAQKKLLKELNREFLFYNIFMPCNKTLTRMSIRGIKYDLEALMKLDEKYRKKSNRLLKKALQLEGVKKCEEHFKRPFNPRSALMWAWLFVEYFKLAVMKSIQKGIKSVGKDVMKKYAEKYHNEYCQLMELYRTYDALRNNQLSGVLDKLVDGRAHTTYSLHATTTGRSASYDPNLLNLHPEVKQCVIAAKPLDEHIPYKEQVLGDEEDWWFVKGDMSQLEVRVMAVMFNDSKLIEFSNKEGEDFHSLVASEVNKEEYEKFKEKVQSGDKKYKEKRRRAKKISFGCAYGETAEGLAFDLGVTKSEAEKFLDEYFAAFPDLKSGIDKIHKHVIKHGWVESYFGLRRSWENHSPDNHHMLRESQNHPIQSTAWSLCQLAMSQIDEKLIEKEMKARVVMQIHDEVIVACPKEEIDIVKKIMKKIMENINKDFDGLNRVKLKVDINVGKKLG